MPRVVVIGGGLAGMTAALELARCGFRVTILEAEHQVGGKAGSFKKLERPRRPIQGGSDDPPYQEEPEVWEDHGYHIFPAWYVNTRRLMHEIGAGENLIPLNCFHFLSRHGGEKGDAPPIVTMRQWSSLTNLAHNIFAGLMPVDETILSYYFMLDLAAEPFSKRAFLDRISANGFLRSRFYATEGIAQQHHQNALQGSSIPYYEISAMTMQKLVRSWFRSPDPLVSILDGPLQERFIEPLRQTLEKLEVEIRLDTTVVDFDIREKRVEKVDAVPSRKVRWGPNDHPNRNKRWDRDDVESFRADYFVLATQFQQALSFVRRDLYRRERQFGNQEEAERHGLADLSQLESAPMAALHVHFNKRLDGIPREHVMLQESRYGLSFIDVSQHWKHPALDHTALNLIASNYRPLWNVDFSEAKRHLMDELKEYLHFTDDDYDERRSCWLQPHVKHPLFLNTVGAWRFRPDSRAGTGVANLFVAGDYCRSDADLTTMESAVYSGLEAAGGLAERAGVAEDIRPLPIPQLPPWLFQAMRFAALPFIASVSTFMGVRTRAAGAAAEVAAFLRQEPEPQELLGKVLSAAELVKDVRTRAAEAAEWVAATLSGKG